VKTRAAVLRTVSEPWELTKDLMRGTLGLPEDAIDLMYPLDSPPER
jgi:hypothetical protein